MHDEICLGSLGQEERDYINKYIDVKDCAFCKMIEAARLDERRKVLG